MHVEDGRYEVISQVTDRNVPILSKKETKWYKTSKVQKKESYLLYLSPEPGVAPGASVIERVLVIVQVERH